MTDTKRTLTTCLGAFAVCVSVWLGFSVPVLDTLGVEDGPLMYGQPHPWLAHMLFFRYKGYWILWDGLWADLFYVVAATLVLCIIALRFRSTKN